MKDEDLTEFLDRVTIKSLTNLKTFRNIVEQKVKAIKNFIRLKVLRLQTSLKYFEKPAFWHFYFTANDYGIQLTFSLLVIIKSFV